MCRKSSTRAGTSSDRMGKRSKSMTQDLGALCKTASNHGELAKQENEGVNFVNSNCKSDVMNNRMSNSKLFTTKSFRSYKG